MFPYLQFMAGASLCSTSFMHRDDLNHMANVSLLVTWRFEAGWCFQRLLKSMNSITENISEIHSWPPAIHTCTLSKGTRSVYA